MAVPDQATVLAGDIGGTKTNLGLFACGEDRPTLLVMESYSSPHSTGLSELIARFVEAHSGSISSACFGIAGPVIDGRCRTTNLPWEVSEAEISQNFGWNKVRLVNDLAATAMAIPLLQGRQLFALNEGRAQKGNIGLAAPGTGLGISLLVFANGKVHAVSSEGGHVDFAPRNETEIDLWRHLRQSHDHVSVERVASGPGIFGIYSWLKARDGYKENPNGSLRK